MWLAFFMCFLFFGSQLRKVIYLFNSFIYIKNNLNFRFLLISSAQQ